MPSPAAVALGPRPATRRLPSTRALVGIAAASVFWFWLFSPATAASRVLHGRYFWIGMTVATALLGGATLVAQRQALGRLFFADRRLVAIGVLHAALLYGLSRLGVWLLANFFDAVMPQIQAIYATRAQLDARLIAVLLVLVIAPMEEVFWRGLVLDELLAVYPRGLAFGLAVALYSLVHVFALNPMLLLAAAVLGAHWSYLYLRFRTLVPGLVSHALWDVAIFVLWPVLP